MRDVYYTRNVFYTFEDNMSINYNILLFGIYMKYPNVSR